MAKSLELVLNDIFKDDKFKYDVATGYYYLNNRVDDTFLFEYYPSRMVLYVSDVVFQYIKANRILGTGNLKKQIIEAMDTMYGIHFNDLYFNNKSVLNEAKFNKLYDSLHPKKVSKEIILPENILDFSKIELELTVHIGHESNIKNKLKTRKVITSNFNKIDITDMSNGYYNLYVYVPNVFYGKKIQIMIDNFVV